MKTRHTDLSSLKIDRSSDRNNSGAAKKLFYMFFFLLIILLIIFLGYIGWNKLFNPGIEVQLVNVSLISPSQSNAVLTASGYVVAQRKASVASKATGRLVHLGVVEGDPVIKDQIIGRLEDDDVKAQLSEAQANLKLYEAELIQAESDYLREKQMLQTGTSTEKQFKAAESQYKKVLASIELAKARIRSAEIAVEYTLIRAPFNGTVLTKNADVGEIVSPLGASATSRAAVVTMADMTSLQVEADVSESNIERIEVEQDCEITLDAYPSFRYAGYVAKIVPTADRSKATVLVKVAFKKYDSRVLPEMSAKVLFLDEAPDTISLMQKSLLVVPNSAVANRGTEEFVFKVVNDQARAVKVQTGKVTDRFTEIISGLVEGEKVIEKIDDKIEDGVKVKI